MGIGKYKNEDQDLFQSNWYKCPNGIIDYLAGLEVKPGVLVIVLTVIRYTEGMGGKKSAAIPNETFMRVLGTNRDKTAYKYVELAVESGLVLVIKKTGCVNHYSINRESHLWQKVQVVSESVTNGDKRHMGSGDKRLKVGAESATLIKTTKENYKDNIKESGEKALFERNMNACETHGVRHTNQQPSINIHTQKWRDGKFEEFYAAYPNKKRLGQAKKNWNNVFTGKLDHKKPSDPVELFKKIMSAVKAQTPEILLSEPQFRKHPGTWLNAQAWLDELTPKQLQSPTSTTRTTPDPLAVNAKWNVPTQMTEEEKRQWFAGDVASDIPSIFMEAK
ncbi:hypothetical protein DFP82_10947 [Psychrobacter fozii]|uniref:Phage replication protein O n=2 Tax=Psychrobacter fozii TaxID=198480 RepID=A0A2V4UZK4_9GAMM|nr:hypothetical protein DFP82_10947 [Psychrobacter fozii]